MAATSTGVDTDSGLLSVVGIPPRLASAQTLPDQLEGAAVTIPCPVVEGYPAARISWFEDGLDMEPEPGLVMLDHNQSLVLGSVQSRHAGEYTCLAQNSEGEDSLTVSLKVLRKTVILSKPAYHQYSEGGQVIFDCQVEVDARQEGVRITW